MILPQTTAPASVSSFLQDYYDHGWLDRDQASRLGRPSGAHRFHYFLRGADPPLPTTGLDSTPFIATFDETGARNAMPVRVSDELLEGLSRPS